MLRGICLELERKQKEIAEKRARESKKKEDLTADTGKYGGLWTTEEEVQSTLASLSIITGNRSTL